MATYVKGHEPTSTDYNNALAYAEDVMNKEACLSNPDMYEWHPSPVTRYPCPQGLTCETGVCKFKESACRSQSQLPYYDCVRKKVSCDTHPSGECEICDYEITLGKNIRGPYTADNVPDGCYAGDTITSSNVPHPAPHTTPSLSLSGFCDNNDQCQGGYSCVLSEPDKVFEMAGQPCETSGDCGGRAVCSGEGHCVADTQYEGTCVMTCETSEDCVGVDPSAQCGQDPGDASLYGRCFIPTSSDLPPQLCAQQPEVYEPYTIEMYEEQEDGSQKVVSSKVPCSSNEQCSIPPGVGGECGMDPSKSTYGFCYDSSSPPYLEWRDEVQVWDGLPSSKNVCMETLPYMRRWCEMPWTRAGSNTDSDPLQPLEQRVKDDWKSRARPPFWYDEEDGTCHVTKTYCTANLKNGGFSAGYGRSRDYWLGSTCSGGSDKSEVVGDYDCCTTLGDNIGEFFLGRTLTTDFRELVQGDDGGFGERWDRYLERGHLDCAGPWAVGTCDQIQPVLNFVSDPKLKDHVVKLDSDVLGPQYPGLNGYEWSWSGLATRLYGLSGRSRGVMAPEVKTHFPSKVRTNPDGIQVVSVTPDDFLYQYVMKINGD